MKNKPFMPNGSLIKRITLITIYITIFTVPWRDVLLITPNLSLTQLLGILGAFFWFLYKIKRPDIRLSRSVIASVLFLIWATLSLSWSPEPVASLTYLIRLIFGIGFFIIITDIIDTEKRFLFAINSYIFGALVTSSRIIWNLIQVLADQGSVVRIYVSVFNINRAAGIIVFSLPLACLAFYKSQKKSLELSYSIIIFAGVISIIASGSRQAIVAVIPLFALYMHLNYIKYNMTLKLITSIGITTLATSGTVAIISSSKIFDRIILLLEAIKNVDIGPRGEIWMEAVSAWSANPVLGIGYRSFAVTTKYIEHNTFLGILTGTGLIGFTLFIYVFISLLRSHYSSIDDYSIIWTFSIAVYIPILMFNDWDFEPTFWLIIAFISASSMIKSSEKSHHEPSGSDRSHSDTAKK